MTDISLRLKRLGKKRLHTVPYRVPAEVDTLEDLLRVCVANEVARYNDSRAEPRLFAFLTPAEIQDQSATGKVGFGALHNPTTVALEPALEVALQAHRDGVFLVFVDDEEVKQLDERLALKTGSIVTFLRLTFLTGLLWK